MKLPNRFISSKNLQEFIEVSETHLNRCVEKGQFKLGIHYIQIEDPNARRPTRRWNPQQLFQLWATDPALRLPGEPLQKPLAKSPHSTKLYTSAD